MNTLAKTANEGTPPSDRDRVQYRTALNEALAEEMRRDPSVFVMGEGIAERGGSYKVTQNLLAEFGKNRVIDTPLCEASFTGAGIGAALTGMRPVVELLFVDFAMLVMDQLVNQAAKVRFMTGDQCRVHRHGGPPLRAVVRARLPGFGHRSGGRSRVAARSCAPRPR